jgi:hypothetical protein
MPTRITISQELYSYLEKCSIKLQKLIRVAAFRFRTYRDNVSWSPNMKYPVYIFIYFKMLESIGEEETFKLMEKDLAHLMETKIFK